MDRHQPINERFLRIDPPKRSSHKMTQHPTDLLPALLARRSRKTEQTLPARRLLSLLHRAFPFHPIHPKSRIKPHSVGGLGQRLTKPVRRAIPMPLLAEREGPISPIRHIHLNLNLLRPLQRPSDLEEAKQIEILLVRSDSHLHEPTRKRHLFRCPNQKSQNIAS